MNLLSRLRPVTQALSDHPAASGPTRTGTIQRNGASTATAAASESPRALPQPTGAERLALGLPRASPAAGKTGDLRRAAQRAYAQAMRLRDEGAAP